MRLSWVFFGDGGWDGVEVEEQTQSERCPLFLCQAKGFRDVQPNRPTNCPSAIECKLFLLGLSLRHKSP
jgi:hypothetical protein